MAEKCLRNASCTCSLCSGFDVASLRSISKSIASTIQYEDDDNEDEDRASAGEATRGSVAPSHGKTALASHVSTVQKDVDATASATSDVVMTDVAAEETLEPKVLAKDVDKMLIKAPGASISLSAVAADGAGSGGPLSLDVVLPKLTDKLWKVRKEAFEALKELFEQPNVTTNQVRAAVELFPKMCEDANASALEAAFAAVLAYTVHVEPFDKAIVSGVMTRVTDKGFSARPGIVKICEELTDAFVAAGAVEETTVALLEGVNNRKPKVPPACLSCLLEALKAYGPRILPLQTIKAALPKLMEGPVKARPMAMSIMVEIHRWTGPALVQDIVTNLRPAQQTEFEGHVKDVVFGQAAPLKFVRGSRPAVATAKASGIGSSGAAKVGIVTPAAFDPRDFAETVDLLARLPKTEFRTKLALPKWSEKVEALKIVLEVIGPVPKLADGDFYELVTTLKALANDSNVNIAAKSIEVFGALADGLRKNFTQYARMVYSEMLRKLSDKKSVILNAANTTLDLFLQHAMTIDMMMDDLKLACDASKNKSPPARVQTMAFLVRAVKNGNVDLDDKAQIVSLATMFLKGIEDSDPKAREAGQTSLIVLLLASDQAHTWLRSIVDEIARKNPRAYKAIQRGLGGEPASTPSLLPDSMQSSRPSNASPSRPSSVSSAASRSSLGDSKTSDVGVASSASANSRSPSLIKRGLRAPLGMRPASSGGTAAKTAPPKKAFAAGSSVGASADGSVCTDFTPVAISVTFEEAEDIIAELQVETWVAIKEGFASPKWMERKGAIEALQEYAGAHSPKMSVRIIEALTIYLAKQVKDFKDSNINVLKSSFEAVGTFAKTAAGSARVRVIQPQDTWKPALAETVKNEFDKTGYDSAKALASVKRRVKDQDEAKTSAADSGALFGRVDVSSQLTKELFECMKNEADKGAWKKRGEAMDTVQTICESAGCAIVFTRSVQEVLRNLRARLNDSNANMKVRAANVIAVVATSVGPDIAKMSKMLGPSLIAGVADNKKTMQSAAIQALHKWVSHSGKTSSSCMESLLSPLAEGLLNTVGRAELLKWATEHLGRCTRLDLHCLVVPAVQCLMDKSSDAREKAQLLLLEVVKSIGKDTVLTNGAYASPCVYSCCWSGN
uniref:TOG domain-containing protein n=1 Tax=Hyaloperonospora arabidopsidis (strain Emoy2) TaxID=559515 RepID=M4BXP9_HYAAE